MSEMTVQTKLIVIDLIVHIKSQPTSLASKHARRTFIVQPGCFGSASHIMAKLELIAFDLHA